MRSTWTLAIPLLAASAFSFVFLYRLGTVLFPRQDLLPDPVFEKEQLHALRLAPSRPYELPPAEGDVAVRELREELRRLREGEP